MPNFGLFVMIYEQIENFIDKNSRTVKETTKNKVVKSLRSVMFVLRKFDLVDSGNTRLGGMSY
jgi:RecA/RadA recombinase